MAVLLAIKNGAKTPLAIASIADKLLENRVPEANKIYRRTVPNYIKQLEELARSDEEVKKILEKLKE